MRPSQVFRMSSTISPPCRLLPGPAQFASHRAHQAGRVLPRSVVPCPSLPYRPGRSVSRLAVSCHEKSATTPRSCCRSLPSLVRPGTALPRVFARGALRRPRRVRNSRDGWWEARPCHISVRDLAARKWIALRLRVAHTPPPAPADAPGSQTVRHENGLHCACALHTHPPSTQAPIPPRRAAESRAVISFALASCAPKHAAGARTQTPSGGRRSNGLPSFHSTGSPNWCATIVPAGQSSHNRRLK